MQKLVTVFTAYSAASNMFTLSKKMFEVLLILDVADLQRRLIAAWSGLQQHVTDEAVDQ